VVVVVGDVVVVVGDVVVVVGDPRALMERMGHSSITVTLGTYGHLLPGLEQALTEALDRAGRAAQEAVSESAMARGWHAKVTPLRPLGTV